MENTKFLEALKLFDEKAEKLKKCSFTRLAFEKGSGITISGGKGKPVKVQRRGPNDESIEAFVLTLRFFIQDNERSSFRNIAELYDDSRVSQQRKEVFKDARKQFNDFLDSKSPLKIKGQLLTHRQILEVFVYGGLAHANEKKKETFDDLMSKPLVNEIVINTFVFILQNAMHFISYVQNLNKEVMGELVEKK